MTPPGDEGILAGWRGDAERTEVSSQQEVTAVWTAASVGKEEHANGRAAPPGMLTSLACGGGIPQALDPNMAAVARPAGAFLRGAR